MSKPGRRTRGPTAAEGAGAEVPGNSMARGIDKVFRTALIVIPIGVVGNVAFTLLVTQRSLLDSLIDRPKGYLVLAIALGVFPWLTNSFRMMIWTSFLGHRLNFRDALRIALVTDLGAAVSPNAVGGGFFKWGMLVQRGVSPGAAASITTLTPIEDGVFFLLAVPIALVATASWKQPIFADAAAELGSHVIPVLLIMGGVALGTWLTLRMILGGGLGRQTRRRGLRIMARMKRSLGGVWADARQVYRLIRVDGKARFALSLSFTGIQWICRYSIVSAIVAFVGEKPQPLLFWCLQWIVFTIASLIPTPGAAGGAEAAFLLLDRPFIDESVLGVVMAGWRFFTFYLLLGIAAILYLLLQMGGRRKEAGK